MKKNSYYQGTERPKKKKENFKYKPEKKVPEVARPTVFFRNYDYSEGEPSSTSSGGGLYHGKMDKFDSVKDFVEQRRKQRRKVRQKEMDKLKEDLDVD
jgi:hypothetical protein